MGGLSLDVNIRTSAPADGYLNISDNSGEEEGRMKRQKKNGRRKFFFSFFLLPSSFCFRLTPKGVLTTQDYRVPVVGSWQISQRPLTVHKGEWGDRLLSRVMAWCLVHWTLSH